MSKLEDQLGVLVERAITLAEKTGEFAIEQAPMLLQEFYRWHITKNIFIAVATAIAIIILYKFFKALGRKEKPDSVLLSDYELILGRWYSEFSGALWGIILGSAVLCLGVAFISSIYDIIFIISAPKIYLIEYFVK